jgi:hypothetical protein
MGFDNDGPIIQDIGKGFIMDGYKMVINLKGGIMIEQRCYRCRSTSAIIT